MKSAELSAGTVHLIYRTLTAALIYAVEAGAIPANPARGVKLPRINRPPAPTMTDEEATAILALAKGHWLENLLRLLMGSAMRLGEATGLNQGDILRNADGTITGVRILRTKTKVRTAAISRNAAAAVELALAKVPVVGPDAPLFVGSRGPSKHRRLNPQTVSRAFQKQFGINPHALRHGAVSRLLARGIAMREIAEQVGHENPAFTARVYAHVEQRRLTAAINLLDA